MSNMFIQLETRNNMIQALKLGKVHITLEGIKRRYGGRREWNERNTWITNFPLLYAVLPPPN